MKVLAAICAMLGAPGLALAQHSVQPIWIQAGDWTLTPIVSTSQSGTVHVDGFLALGDKTVLGGSNITSVWYNRVGDDAWESKTWNSTDQWEAIKYLKTFYQINDQYDCAWPTSDLNTGGVSTEIPKQYLDGLKIDDPIIEGVIESTNRDQLVTSLVSVGYGAADLPFERKGATPCAVNVKITGLAVGVEAEAAANDPMSATGITAALAYVAARCVPPCDLATWTIRSVGAWAPSGAWSVVAPGAGTTCSYTQPMSQTVTTTRFVTFTNCLTLPVWTSTSTNTGTQSVTCPNAAGGTCPATPNCLGTVTPGPVVPTPPTYPWWCHWLW